MSFKMIAKWLLTTVLGLLSIVLLILLLIVGALFTNSGLNAVLWGAQKALPQLEVKRSEGAFFPHFSLFDVSFKDDDLHIDVESREITLAINPKCLLASSVCIDQVNIDGLDVSLTDLPAANEGEPEPASEPITDVTLPIPVYVDALALTDISLDILGTKVDWKTFTTQIEMSGRTLTIYPTLFEDVNVELAESTEQPDESENTPTTEKEPKAITLPDLLIPLEIDLQQFDLNRFTLKGETSVVVNHLGLSAHVDGYAVEVKKLIIDAPQADIELTSAVELKGEYPLKLDAQALMKQADFKGQKLTLKTEGSVAEIQLNAHLTGLAELALAGQVEPLKPTLPFDIELTDGHVQWPLTGGADYTVDIDLINAKGSLEGYQLQLETVVDGKEIPKLDMMVKGDGNLQQIELESILIKTLGGEVSGQVMANWQNPINWQATLGVKDIQPGLQWEQAEGIINGSLSTTGKLLESGGWQVELPLLDIDGVVRDYPLNIDGQISVSDLKGSGDIQIVTDGLGINHGPNGIKISGQLAKDWAIDTEINVPDIEKTLVDVKGSIGGTVALRGALHSPEVIANILAKNIAYLDLATVSNISLSSDIEPLPSPAGDLEIKVDNVVYEGNIVDSVVLSFSGSQKEHQLSLDMFSELLKANIRIRGGLEKKPEFVWKGALSQADISTVQGPWELDHPVALDFFIDSQIVDIQAHCWTQSSSKVCLTKDLTAGESGEAYVEVQNFSFSQLGMFIPKDTQLEGEVDVKTSARWSADKNPDVQIAIELPKGNVTQHLEQPVVLGWESIGINALLQNDKLTADWLLDITDNGDIKGSLKIADVLSTHQGLDAQLILENINLNMIQPLLGKYSKVDADINSDIRVSGPVKHPRIDGQFIINNIVAQGDIAPIDIQAGKLQVDFSGYDALLNADIETPDGVLQLDGDANWQDLQAWRANVKVFAEELNVELLPIVQVKVKPNMTIGVTPKLAKIEGDIYLPWGRIVVEELPPSAVSVSSDEVILGKNLQPVEQETDLPMDIETNVNIHIGDDFTLSAFGLEGGLVGKLNVTQKDKGPFIVGEIEVIDGSYRSFGQDLLIDEGKVLMNGPADQPYLAINAIRNPDNTQDDVVAGIRVTGPANEPSIEVYSDPSMPQQNALSYLLRGQDIDATSGGNGMTTALIGLSLAKSGRLVGEIGETFGVSDLQLDTAGSGDESQVTVSGYITPELQLKYGVGIFDSFGEFTIRYKLFTDLYLEAVSGMDSAVDLLYQFEFD